MMIGPEINIYSLILLIGAAHGLFLSLTLVNLKDSQDSGRYFLALLTMAFAVDLAHEFLIQTNLIRNLLPLFFVDPVINLLYGPALFLYVRSLTAGIKFRFQGMQWLHFLPFFLALIAITFLSSVSGDQFERLYNSNAVTLNDAEQLIKSTISTIALVSTISLGIYMTLNFKQLINHHRLLKRQFSSIEKITLNWLQNLSIAFAILYLLLLLYGFLPETFYNRSELVDLIYLTLVAIIYAMGYMGMKQPTVFASREALDALETELSRNSDLDSEIINQQDQKYKTSSLDSDMSLALKEEIEKYMIDEQPYLESQITLPELAKMLGISSNYLSQVVNEQLNVNFFDFINKYRVKESQRILVSNDSSHLSIIDIAFAAGFNSKSSFYTAFRKHVGKTPGEYRKSLK